MLDFEYFSKNLTIDGEMTLQLISGSVISVSQSVSVNVIVLSDDRHQNFTREITKYDTWGWECRQITYGDNFYRKEIIKTIIKSVKSIFLSQYKDYIRKICISIHITTYPSIIFVPCEKICKIYTVFVRLGRKRSLIKYLYLCYIKFNYL